MTPADITREALTWIGVPFKWQGRSRRGLDCGGLPAVVGMSLGLFRAEPPRYRPTLPHGYLIQELGKHLVERPGARKSGCGNGAPDCCAECLESFAGCVVVLGILGAHCGIVTDDGRIVSVGDAAGVHAAPFTSDALRLLRAAFEFPGVVYR